MTPAVTAALPKPRAHLGADLSEFVEVADDEIVRSEELGSSSGGLTETILWVRFGTKLTRTRTVTLKAQGEFLEGSIAQTYLRRSAAETALSAGIQYPRTEDLVCRVFTYCSSCASVFGSCPTGVGCGVLEN
jgi:hypothetical protein